jgi:hypothetical protein
MKRKIFWAVALLAILSMTAVAPLVQAQDKKKQEQLQNELMTLEQKMATGKATQADFARYQEVGIEMLMLMNPKLTRAQAQAQQQQMMQTEMLPEVETKSSRQLELERQEQQIQAQFEKQQQQLEQQEAERKLYPGDTRGWPSSAWLRNAFDAKLSSLKQPAGTNASYDKESSTIYLTGANANTFQELKKQIESALGSKMEGSGNSFEAVLSEAKGRFGSAILVKIYLEGNQIRIVRWQTAA